MTSKRSDETIHKYWERAEAFFDIIKASRTKMTDSDFAMHIMKGLPSEFKYFKRSTEIYDNDEEFDLATYKRRLLQEEAKIEIDKKFQLNASGAFMSRSQESDRQDADRQERTKWTAYQNTKPAPGEKQPASKAGAQDGSSRGHTSKRGVINCYRCNTKGHIGRDCPKYGDAANEKCRIEAEKHRKDANPDEDPATYAAWMLRAEVSTPTANPCYQGTEWILDSGASDTHDGPTKQNGGLCSK